LELLQSSDRGLSRALRQVLPEGGQLLLVIDQFEELFTLTSPEGRDLFLNSIVTALGDRDPRLRVVATVRADFFDGPLSHPAIGDHVQHGSMLVPPMSQLELTEAITLPAQAVGVTVEPALVTHLVTDVHGAPGSMPLLQYALTELFDGRAGSTITEDAYNQLGGITGALATRAEDLFQQLDEPAQVAARRVFGRLVNLGEGTEDTRRRVDQAELAIDPATEQVLDTYGQARLLSFDRNAQTRSPTVEVAHEALIREWPRFRDWINDDRDMLRALAHLAQAAHAWDERGRDTADLYRGARLDTAALFPATNERLTELESAYIGASIDEDQHERNQQRRTNRRLRTLLVATGALLALALLAGSLALQNSRTADQNARRADQSAAAALESAELADARATASELDRLVSTAQSLATRDRPLSRLLALEAYRLRPDLDAERTLLQAVVTPPAPSARRELSAYDSVALARGSGLVGLVHEGVLRLFEPTTGAQLAEVEGGWTAPLIALSASGEHWAVADRLSGDVTSGDWEGRTNDVAKALGPGLSSLSISDDGRYVVAGTTRTASFQIVDTSGAPGTLWDLTGGFSQPIGSGDGGPITQAQVNSSGVMLVGEGRLWTLSYLNEDGRRLFANFDPQQMVFEDGSPVSTSSRDIDATSVLLLPEGAGYILGTAEGVLTTFQLTDLAEHFGRPVFLDNRSRGLLRAPLALAVTDPIDLSGFGAITALTALERPGLVAVGTDRGFVAIVDVSLGTVIRRPQRLSRQGVTFIARRNDGGGLSILGGSELTLWDDDYRGDAATLLGYGPGKLSSNDSGYLHASDDGTVSLLDDDLALIRSVSLGPASAALIAPKNDLVVVVADDERCTTFPFLPCRSTLSLLDPHSLAAIATTTIATDGAHAPLVMSPEGELVAVGASNGQLVVADRNGQIIGLGGSRTGPEYRVSSVAFITETRLATTHDDGSLVTWRLTDEGLTEDATHLDLTASAVARLDDERLLLGRMSGTIDEISVNRPDEPLRSFRLHSQRVEELNIEPESQRLTSSTADEVVVWDLTTGVDLVTIKDASDGRLMAGGQRLTTSSPRDPNTLVVPAVWDLDLDDSIQTVCELAVRNLTLEEWEFYLPADEVFQETCGR